MKLNPHTLTLKKTLGNLVSVHVILRQPSENVMNSNREEEKILERGKEIRIFLSDEHSDFLRLWRHNIICIYRQIPAQLFN